MRIRDRDLPAGVPSGREIEHRFVEGYAGYLIDDLTARAEREGASMEAVLLAFICAAIGVSRKHHLEDRVDLMLALLRAGGITFRNDAQGH
ncbi:hypothetical protein [Arenibaculum sp.]|jgi:hypothetical protein|uniref:hypothetical protein n=1 Tax=Arenibaculum sp. TaxID=2865862 RepID=UPI002E0FD171|nr:hypothetical protein [Arenibaculum sp.]